MSDTAKPRILLPTEIVRATNKNPRDLIIFSKPKVGKTSALAQLPNSLILDFEKGTALLDAFKVEINNLNELNDVIAQIRTKNTEEGKPKYDYGVLDTVTKLEEMCIPLAEQLYAKSPRQTWGL